MKKTNRKITAAIIAVLSAVAVAVPVAAIGPDNSHANGRAFAATPPAQGAAGQNAPAGQGASQGAANRANAQNRLSEAKLKACENRQAAITNIMSRISDRGQKQLDLFSTIATRVESFYTEKGKTLATYDSLVSDVNAKKDAAQTTVDSIKTNSTGFDCSSSDPKAFVNSFQSSLKDEISALQAYRTSVKNLIVGVKSVQSTTATTTGTQGTTNNTTTGGNQ